MQTLTEQLFTALQAAGMPTIPDEFSVVPVHQSIPYSTLVQIEQFIRVFDRVTRRPAWQQTVTATAPEIARYERTEVCFFSAWDFHLPPGGRWQLIEFNDNGSGLLFAGLINWIFYQLGDLAQDSTLYPPLCFAGLATHLIQIVEREIREFFGVWPQGLILILDDALSLREGRFRRELVLLRNLFHGRGWKAAVACPEETRWDGRRLLYRGQQVCFIVNRSTDFFWQAEVFSGLQAAYRAGRVYIAPNPFTYATRSDKRLLELLAFAHWDQELGIQPEERAILSAHVPETHLLRADNLEELARRKREFVFKPAQGFASRGLLTGSEVGRSRLRQLLKKEPSYIAQHRVPKSVLSAEDTVLWTDLRVWAYQGERLLLSGRASPHPDRLELTPPGGWLPTYTYGG